MRSQFLSNNHETFRFWEKEKVTIGFIVISCSTCILRTGIYFTDCAHISGFTIVMGTKLTQMIRLDNRRWLMTSSDVKFTDQNQKQVLVSKCIHDSSIWYGKAILYKHLSNKCLRDIFFDTVINERLLYGEKLSREETSFSGHFCETKSSRNFVPTKYSNVWLLPHICCKSTYSG